MRRRRCRPPRDAHARTATASQNPEPSLIISDSQSVSVAASCDVARLHRPFDPARIGERADRIGRRQPGHQAVERPGIVFFVIPGRAGFRLFGNDAIGTLPLALPAQRHSFLFLSHGRDDHDGDDGARANDRANESAAPSPADRTALRSRSPCRRARAASPPARDRAGCGCEVPRSARRCGDCRDARPAARIRAARMPSISASGSVWPATSTIEPSSSTRPSPSRSVTGLSKSIRTCVPFSPVSTMRRRVRSSASSVTRSMAAAAFQVPAAEMEETRCMAVYSMPVVPAERSESRAPIHHQLDGLTGSPHSRATTAQTSSKQKIPLRHRQHIGRCAGEQFAVRPHLVGLRIDVELRRGTVMDHALLGDAAAGIAAPPPSPSGCRASCQVPPAPPPSR